MKVKLTGQIKNLEKDESTGFTRMTISCKEGKVSNAGPNAQEAMLLATLSLKSLVADKMTLGASITFTITDEEPKEG